MDDGTLLPGPTGERLLEHYSFSSAFKTPEEYCLVAHGRTLGTLPIEIPLVLGGYLIYAGKRWRIIAVDDRQKVIDLESARGGKAPQFVGEGSTVSGHVRRAMREFYLRTDLPPFLDTNAKRLVTEGRDYFRRFELDRSQMVSSGPKGAYLFPWADDHVVATLALAFNRRGVKSTNEGACLLFEDTSADDLHTLLQKIYDDGMPDAVELAQQVPNTIVDKYDSFLTPELRWRQYAARRIRVEETLAVIREVLAG